ncbi:hypothetical protein N9Y40_02835 [Porticoccaceae bacterium]|nr:hypothetical protein [Porticoccaceae bacterium]
MKLIAIGIVVLIVPFLPVPDFMQNIGTVTLPESIAWGWEIMQVDFGLGVVIAAISARFLRRLIMSA